ncbi:hypothetical protein FBHYGVHD_CDS0036 [Staphylococcus phage MVC_VPHSA1]|uniref:Uncharacterized protein n=1 Tax=Staphylococcus phage MVC_VPHSA1 TaxID=3088876 RepID=A0ABZ0QYR1_9CAUD|nr:hypothetical protein FBHYGVHD_CDS0036 [Staphylococcus phage MVC_VPHSA1]
MSWKLAGVQLIFTQMDGWLVASYLGTAIQNTE